jgi:hypothetical protein
MVVVATSPSDAFKCFPTSTWSIVRTRCERAVKEEEQKSKQRDILHACGGWVQNSQPRTNRERCVFVSIPDYHGRRHLREHRSVYVRASVTRVRVWREP